MAKIQSSPSLSSLGHKISASILTVLIVILLPFILAIIVGPILIIRQIVARLAKLFHPEISKLLTHRSTNFSLAEVNHINHTEYAIVADYVFEGNYQFESFRKRFVERVVNKKLPNRSDELKYPELQQYVVTWMGFNFWKDEDSFDINDHIRLYNATRPTGSHKNVDQEEFHKLRETFLNSPFPENKSPWEVLLVQNYLPDDPTLRSRMDKNNQPLSVMILKVHHSLGDGFAMKKLVSLDWYGNKEIELSPAQNTNKSRLSQSDESFGNFLLKRLKSAFKAATFPIRAIYEFTSFTLQLMNNRSCWDVNEAKRAPAVISLTDIISISRIKRIKDELSVSFSSVLFHVCNESTMKIMMKKQMPFAESIIASFPLPLRNHPDKLRNHMTHGAITLPTSLDMTPRQRLAIVHSHYEQIKNSTLPFAVLFMSTLVGGMFTSIVRIMSNGLVPPIFISSFPASQHDNWIVDGHKILSAYVNIGMMNLSGLGFCVISKANDIRFGITANSKILNSEEVKELARYIEREIEILENEIVPESVSVR